MNDQQLLRYSRHIFLPEIDIDGQEKINAAHVLMVGAGGLGSACGYYLAASGVGKLSVFDGDEVDLSNLQRQIVHLSSSIGQNKADSAKNQFQALNPEIAVQAYPTPISEQDLNEIVPSCDVIVDCSDNFKTRYLVNAACARHRKPLVSGAAVRFSGQICVMDFREFATSGCYNCLFPQDDQYIEQDLDEMRCINAGVFSPLVGQIGSMQAAEVLKLLLDLKSPLLQHLFVFNGLTLESRLIKRHRDPHCEICQP